MSYNNSRDGGRRDDNRRSHDSRENRRDDSRRSYEGRDSRRDDNRRSYDSRDGRRDDNRRSYEGRENRRDDSRRPYEGNRAMGPGRRTYGDAAGNPPRVGRVARDVPRAERVSGDYQPRPVRREDFVERDFTRGGRRDEGRYGGDSRRGEPLHRGGAYRAENGPRGRRPEADYEPPEIPEDLAAEFTDVPFDDEHLLAGRNPIREALKAGRPMEKLLVASGDLSGAAREIIHMARDAGVVVQQVDRARLDQIYPAHQGMLAYVAAVPYAALEDILASAKEKGEEPFLILLDGVTDPHNLGAIIRSAECAGAHGVVVPERRAAGLSPAAAKAAAGALNHMPVARVKNLNRAIEELQEAGVWVIGTAMNGENALTADLSGPIALVIGSEGDGIARLTLEKCDRTISLPMLGKIESLNASVAAGILMYEVVRARAK